MKKIFALMVLAGMFACADNETGVAVGDSDTTSVKEDQASANLDARAKEGLKLVAGSDCFQCHKVAEPFTGPAYQEVAERYRDSTISHDTLAIRIIEGSTGHWGSIPMTAHPELNIEDAKKMVHYVLSLKK